MKAKCTCVHIEQDKMYGLGMRIMNPTRSGKLRCTVCLKEHNDSRSAEERKAEKSTKKGGKK